MTHPEEESPIAAGTRIGPYEVESFLARGAMGMLLRAVDAKLDRPVAIKIIDPRYADDGDFRARFVRECQVLAKMRHPNVVMIYFFDEFRGSPYFAMELVEGSNLETVLGETVELEWRKAVGWMIQCCKGLSAARHEGIIHRDLKPANILLDTREQIRIVDFGLAKSQGASKQVTAAAMVVGTPHYMSPEQAKGFELDWRSDLYSLGATFYHLLSGQTVFEAESAMEVVAKHIREPPVPLGRVRRGLPVALCSLIDGLLAKDPQDRGFGSYAEVSASLGQILDQSQTPAQAPSATLVQPRNPPPAALVAAPALSGATLVVPSQPPRLRVEPPQEGYAWLECDPTGTGRAPQEFPYLRDVALISSSVTGFGTDESNAIYLPFARSSCNEKRVSGRGGHGALVWTPEGFSLRTLRHRQGKGLLNECRLDGGAILEEGDFPVRPGSWIDLRGQFQLHLAGSVEGGLRIRCETLDQASARKLPVTWSLVLLHQRVRMGTTPEAGICLPGEGLPSDLLTIRMTENGFLVEPLAPGILLNGSVLEEERILVGGDRLEGPGFRYFFRSEASPRDLWGG